MSVETREGALVSPSVEAAPRARAARPRRGSWTRWVVLAVLAVVIAGVASTVRGTAFVYSKYVDEIMAPGASAHWVGRVVRVEGLVQPNTIQHRDGTREVRFRVYKNHASLPVEYAGIIPDTFRDCAGVTVRGVLQADGRFLADEIVAKCPSKYEAATVVNGECIVGGTVSPSQSGMGGGPAVR